MEARVIYILAFFLPPLALLFEGRFIALVLNLVLLVVCIPFGILIHPLLLVPSAHAIIVIAEGRRRREHRETLEAIRESGRDPRDFGYRR
jgi:hypothetical protein